MSSRFPELDQARIVVSPVTRERHLSVVGAALSERTQRSSGRGRALSLALALVLLVPVMALAAENAVPGDFLYPVKIAVEPVVRVFDYDAPAERRVREVEVLWERDAADEVIVQHVDVAREAVPDYQPTLSDRIDQVAHDLDTRRADREEVAKPHKLEDERPGRVVPIAPADRPEPSSTTSTTVEETSASTRPSDGGRDG